MCHMSSLHDEWCSSFSAAPIYLIQLIQYTWYHIVLKKASAEIKNESSHHDMSKIPNGHTLLRCFPVNSWRRYIFQVYDSYKYLQSLTAGLHVHDCRCREIFAIEFLHCTTDKTSIPFLDIKCDLYFGDWKTDPKLLLALPKLQWLCKSPSEHI